MVEGWEEWGFYESPAIAGEPIEDTLEHPNSHQIQWTRSARMREIQGGIEIEIFTQIA